MGDVPGDDGDISRPEEMPGSIIFHVSAVRQADSDLQTVMEVEFAGRNVGNMPSVPAEEEDGEVDGELVIAVFHYSFLGFCHGQIPFFPNKSKQVFPSLCRNVS